MAPIRRAVAEQLRIRGRLDGVARWGVREPSGLPRLSADRAQLARGPAKKSDPSPTRPQRDEPQDVGVLLRLASAEFSSHLHRASRTPGPRDARRGSDRDSSQIDPKTFSVLDAYRSTASDSIRIASPCHSTSRPPRSTVMSRPSIRTSEDGRPNIGRKEEGMATYVEVGEPRLRPMAVPVDHRGVDLARPARVPGVRMARGGLGETDGRRQGMAVQPHRRHRG